MEEGTVVTGEEETETATATVIAMVTGEEEQQATTCPLWRNSNMRMTNPMTTNQSWMIWGIPSPQKSR